MNRLFKKISVAFAGLAMAVGVGVALGNAKPAVEAKAETTQNETLNFQNLFGSQADGTVIPTTDGTYVRLTFNQNDGSNPTKWYSTGSGIRAYVKNQITISATHATYKYLTQIVFNYSGNSYTMGSATVSGGTYSTLEKVGTWTSSAGLQAVTITSANICRLQSMVITLSDTHHDLYSVYYNANGGSGTMTDSNEYKSNDSVTVKANSFTAPTGFDFSGWNTEQNGTGESYVPGNTFPITASTTLYAQWTLSSDLYISDKIVPSDLEATDGNYVSFSGLSKTSSAKYLGSTAFGNEAIQINSTATRGIGTSQTGGYLKKVIVSWNENTTNGRKIYVYGSNNPYSTSFNTGTKIGEIALADSVNGLGVLEADSYYPYISVFASGAVYLNYVDLRWQPIKPVSISVSGDDSLSLNSSLELTATLTNSTYVVSETGLAWSISPSGQGVTVNNGVVTTAANATPGEYTITAKSTADESVFGTKVVTVTAADTPVSGITLDITSYNLYVGETLDLTATISPNGATNKTVNWYIENTGAAASLGVSSSLSGEAVTVSAGLNPGTAVVTAKADGDESKVATCTITIVEYPTYSLITSTDDLYDGMKVIIAANAGTSILSTTQNTNNRGQVASAKNDNIVTPAARGFAELTLGVEEMSNGTVVYTFYDSANSGYLYAAGANSNNYLKTQNSVSNSARFAIEIRTVTQSVTPGKDAEPIVTDYPNSAVCLAQNGNSRNYIKANTASSLFSCYEYPNDSTGTPISLFAKVGQTISNAQKVDTFVAKFMKPTSISTENTGESGGYNACKTNWANVLAAYNGLSDDQKALFCSDAKYANAHARLNAWADANGYKFGGSGDINLVQKANYGSVSVMSSPNSPVLPIIIAVMIGAVATGGLFFALRRRKER